MDHSCNPRKKGGMERRNTLMVGGNEKTNIQPSNRKTPYFSSHTQDRDFCSWKWSEAQHLWGKEFRKEPQVSQTYHKTYLTHAQKLTCYLSKDSGAIGQSMNLDFTEFILICEERGSEGRLVGSILTMYAIFNSFAPVFLKCSWSIWKN